MVISHVINSLDKTHGGPSYSVVNLAESLTNRSDMHVLVQTYASEDPLVRDSEKSNLDFRFSNYHSGQKPLGFFSNDLETEGIDLFHGHGLWQPPIYFMSRVARKKRIPYVISCRGMLAAWALGQDSLKKKAAMWLYQRKVLEQAACIHATSLAEAKDIRHSGINTPIAVIPNGINANPFSQLKNSELKETRRVLMLSRLHPEKRVDVLIEAWGRMEATEKAGWTVDIVGNGEEDYVERLKQQIEAQGLQNEITIHGPAYGHEKLMRYQQANLFVLPTSGENFGVAVAEALASGLPVITTKGAPWQELVTHRAGWWIDHGPDSLLGALQEAVALTDDERMAMGARGRAFVVNNYSLDMVAAWFHDLYNWLVLRTEKPEFVLN